MAISSSLARRASRDLLAASLFFRRRSQYAASFCSSGRDLGRFRELLKAKEDVLLTSGGPPCGEVEAGGVPEEDDGGGWGMWEEGNGERLSGEELSLEWWEGEGLQSSRGLVTSRLAGC